MPTKRLFHYYRSVEFALELLETGSLWFSSLRCLNDPMESVFPIFRKIADNDLQIALPRPYWAPKIAAGIYCLTRSPNNLRMWAEYANDGAELCIGFDLSPWFQPWLDDGLYFSNLRDTPAYWAPVKYDVVNDIQLLNDDSLFLDSRQLVDVLRRKTSDFAFEDEERLIITGAGNTELTFPKTIIRDVFTGSRTSRSCIREIKQLTSKSDLRHVRLTIA